MDRLQREYDRFGPWVTVIEGDEDIPHQFLRAREEILGAEYAFKIPINVQRRNVRKGMALYTTVITFSDDTVTIYERTKSDFDTTTLACRDILYIQYGLNLLVGELLLATADQLHLFSFNSIQTEPVEKVVRLIREKYAGEQTYVDVYSIEEDTTEKSMLYKSLIAEDFSNEEVRVVGYQPPVELGKTDRKKLTLQDLLVLAGLRETIIITRDKQEKVEDEPDYGFKYSFIPWANITGVTLERDDRNEQESTIEHTLTVHLGGTQIVFLVGEDFPVQRIRKVSGTA